MTYYYYPTLKAVNLFPNDKKAAISHSFANYMDNVKDWIVIEFTFI